MADIASCVPARKMSIDNAFVATVSALIYPYENLMFGGRMSWPNQRG